MTGAAMGFREQLAAIRALGVRWRKGRLPFYPATMTPEHKREADAILDAMPDTLYNTHCDPARKFTHR